MGGAWVVCIRNHRVAPINRVRPPEEALSKQEGESGGANF